MKIEGQGKVFFEKLLAAFESQKKPAQATRKEQGDAVEISPEARSVPELVRLTMAIPEIREDKVKAISEQLQDGTYQVSLEDLADSIIEEMRICRRS